MKKKIIVLCLKLTELKYKMYEIDQIKKKYDIEIHQCINFLLPNTNIRFGKNIKIKNLLSFKNFSSWKSYMLKQVEIQKKKHKKIILIDTISGFDHFGNNFNWFSIYYFLKKNNILFIKYHFPGLPQFLSENLLSTFYLKKILANFKTLIFRPIYSFNRIKENSFYFIGKYLNLYPNLIFVAGKENLKRIKSKKIKNMKVVSFSANDFSQFLIEKKNHSILKTPKKYAVFLSDRDYNLVPEDALYDINYKSQLTYNNWHKPLIKFFDNVEKNLNVKIIIAAHPKSLKKNTINIYRPRKVYFNNTNKLIKNSKFAITLRSTALNYSAIYNKPIMFISSNALTKTTNRFIKFIANKFGQNPININEPFNKNFLNNFLKFDYRSLNKYKVDYISTLLKEKPNYKIIIENLNMI